MSKQPVALIIYQHGDIIPFRIKPKNGFFVINEPNLCGLFMINDKYRFMWNGRTTTYLYAAGNMTPIDPVKINEINDYKKANRLAQITQKDIKDGIRLRYIGNRTNGDSREAYEKLKEIRKAEGEKINQGIQEKMMAIHTEIKERKEKHGQTISYSPEQTAVMLLEFLVDKDLITKEEHSSAVWKIENNKLSFKELLNSLQEYNLVSVAQPLHESVEDFIQDLQIQNETKVASVIQDHRVTKKGLKQYRQPIIKSWISTALIAGVIIGITMIPFVLWQVGIINNFNPRLMAIGGVALIIVLGRYHFPLTLPPIALVFYPNKNIKPFKIKRESKIFLLNHDKYKKTYQLNNSLRLMWAGKIPCYMFIAGYEKTLEPILEEFNVLRKPRRMKIK